MELNTMKLSQLTTVIVFFLFSKSLLIYKIMLGPSPPAEENEPRLVNTNENGNGGTDRFLAM